MTTIATRQSPLPSLEQRSSKACYFALRIAGSLLLAFSQPVYGDPQLPVISNQTFVVTNSIYGAVGDGTTDNTLAIRSAINDASTNGGGTVQIPANGTLSTYLCGPLTLASQINLQIDGGATLKALPLPTFTNYPAQNLTFPDLIYAKNVTDIEISGSGTIDGQGAAWWTAPSSVKNNRPYMIFFNGGCQRVWVHGVTLQNPMKMHVVFKGTDSDITFNDMTINTTAANAPNTDGIDLIGSHCLVQNCTINAGDDNIALGSSGGVAFDILITNCTFGVGHGVSIGSNTSGGVSNVTVVACTFDGTDYGIRMKSNDGSPGSGSSAGVVQNLTYSDITMTNILDGAIVIYSYYLGSGGGNIYGTPTQVTPFIASTQTVTDVPPIPVWRNITISNLTASVVPGGVAGIIWGRKTMPVTNLTLSSVNISASKPFEIYNARAIQIIDSQITVPGTTNTLVLYNAEVTVTNSAVNANLVTLGGLATSGTNNTLSVFNAQAGASDPAFLGSNPLLTLASSTITVSNNLSLGASTLLNFGLGTTSTRMAVTGNLTLGGTLNITDAGGFAAGTYTLFSYGGTLMDNGLAIGATPDGTLLYSLDESTAGLVNLVVAVPAVAAFSGSPTNGFAPLVVTFTDTSTGPITNRFWDFGDGTLSNTTATSVMHTYTMAGTNTVQLVVSAPSSVSTSVLPDYITVVLCSATLSATNDSFGVLGGSNVVTVTPVGACLWTANSNDAWIQITGGSVITNSSAAVTYTVLPNTSSTSPRMGTMTIAGQTFTITEAGDSVPPTVTLTAPTSGTVSNTVLVSATAIDNVGVARVDFYRDNSLLLGSVTTPPYSLNFNSATLGEASVCFYAKAYDGAGNVSVSSTNCVAVDNHTLLPAQVGDYNGLVIQTNAPSYGSSGSVAFKVSKTGSFTAKLVGGGGRLSFSGQFDGSGNATNAIARKGLNPLQIALHVDLGGSDQISGTVSDPSFTSVLLADRVAFDNTNPCPFAGNFSIILAPPQGDDSVIPQGYGYGTLNVATTGRGRLRGVLADGTKISIMAPVSKQGTWPLYQTLYKNQGAAIGWATLTSNTTVDATVDWFRPPLPFSLLYPAGFTTNVTLIGKRYVPPAAGNTSGAGNFQMTLGGGNLMSPIIKDAFLYNVGSVVVMSANPESVQMKVDPVTGQFKGSFVHPSLNKTVKFTGSLPEFRSMGAGYFLGATESGFVTFVPTP